MHCDDSARDLARASVLEVICMGLRRSPATVQVLRNKSNRSGACGLAQRLR